MPCSGKFIDRVPGLWSQPRCNSLRWAATFPIMHPVGMDPYHLSRALGVRVESRMLEGPPDRRRHLSPSSSGTSMKTKQYPACQSRGFQKSPSRVKNVGCFNRCSTGRMSSSPMLWLATSGPICRTARPHSRSRQTSISEMFSSMTNMRFENPFVLEQPARQFHGFRDRLHRHLPPPRPHDALPRRAAGHLLQHLEHHDARAFERRLAVAHLRIRHDVLAEFQPLLLAIAVRFHK